MSLLPINHFLSTIYILIQQTLFLFQTILYTFYSHRNALTNTTSIPQPHNNPNSNPHHPYHKNDHLTTSTTPRHNHNHNHNLTYTRHHQRTHERTPPPHKIPLQRPLPKAPSPPPLLLPQRPPTHPLPETQKTPRPPPPQTHHHLTTTLPITAHNITLLPQHRLPRIPLRRAGRRRRRCILGVCLRPTDPHILCTGGTEGPEWRAGDDGRGGVRGVCATEDVGADEGGDAC